jgi:hypothetical protein
MQHYDPYITINLRLFFDVGLEFSEWLLLDFVAKVQARPENGGKFPILPEKSVRQTTPYNRLINVVLSILGSTVKTRQGADKYLKRLVKMELLEVGENCEYLQVKSKWFDLTNPKAKQTTQKPQPQKKTVPHTEQEKKQLLDDVKIYWKKVMTPEAGTTYTQYLEFFELFLEFGAAAWNVMSKEQRSKLQELRKMKKENKIKEYYELRKIPETENKFENLLKTMTA